MPGKSSSHTYYETLALTADGPIHGYELGVKHREHFGSQRQLAYGQLYASLKRLQAAGLIETLGSSPGPGPARTAYRITETGRVALQDWLTHFDPSEPVEQLFRKVLTLPLVFAHEAAIAFFDRYIAQLKPLDDAAASQVSSPFAAARDHFDSTNRSMLLAWMREVRQDAIWL